MAGLDTPWKHKPMSAARAIGTALSGSKPKNVWVIEDDAAYSGDVLRFVRSYENLSQA